MIDTDPVLEMEQIEKRFGTAQALAGANVSVGRGTVHALLGENGAGKTTLMRIAYGMEASDRGVLRIHGQRVHLRSPADAIANGIGMVHQHFTLVPAMTVVENIALGGHGLFDERSSRVRVDSLTRMAGFTLDPTARAAELSVAAQQRLELVKVLAHDANILILDEPTAVLAPAEVDDLLRLLRELADGGRTVVLITHKLREALRIADHVTVLRQGVTTLQQARAAVDESTLIQAMLGQRELPAARVDRRTAPQLVGPVLVRARNVSIVDGKGVTRIRTATFDIRAGEVVGVAAVDGSGHRELLRAIAGRMPATSGTLDAPRSAGFVPDDRHRDGLVLPLSLSQNYALKHAGERKGVIRWRDVAKATRRIMSEFDVRAESDDVPVYTLSGGNQQKFVLGRELDESPSIVIVENPTRGLDVKSSQYVRGQLLEACSRGAAILWYSSDIDEVLAVADRVLVVFAGSVREVAADATAVGRAIVGAA